MKRQHLLAAMVAAGAAALVLGWTMTHGRKNAAEPAGVKDTSVLVQTQPLRQQPLPLVMHVFGEIGAGRPQALSFPQAGQLIKLPLVLGQQVHGGEIVAAIASDPAAVSSYAQAASAAGFARRELQRTESLLGLQLATQSQVDAARKQLADAEAALAAQAKLGGAHPEASLSAPFDGIVTALPVAQGDRVPAGATVVQIGRADHLRALLAVEPAQSPRVKAGMSVSIRPVQDGAAEIRARIDEVQALVDPKSQMVTAIAELSGGGASGVVAGTRVQAAIRLGERTAWAVPRQAVLSDEKGSYLFQVAAQRARRVNVTRVVESDGLYGVDGRLDPNLPVVVVGNYELEDGMRIREAAR